MPVAAFTMAGILFFYARTSIRAAKLNAQQHREADGGQFSWANESQRRHGMRDKVGGNAQLVKDALLSEVDQSKKPVDPSVAEGAERNPSDREEELKKALGRDSRRRA
jgi:hypothetical protein